MSLFPAYASGNRPSDDCDFEDQVCASAEEVNLSANDEARLLASESSGSEEAFPSQTSRQSRPATATDHTADLPFYVDTKMELSYLSLSTLYWPGRPQYAESSARHALSGRRRKKRKEKRAPRYFTSAAPPSASDERHERAAARRRALAAAPHDHLNHLRYIDFLEQEGEESGLLEHAAAAALAALGAAGPAARCVRSRLSLALKDILPPAVYERHAHEALAAEQRGDHRHRCTLLSLAVSATALAAGGDAGADGVLVAAEAALRDPAVRHQDLYPTVLYVYGSFLRSAGLWEQLVLLVEMVVAIAAPPAALELGLASGEASAAADAEADLLQYELRTARSGLPLSEVWARVERARAALHWRPAAADAPADHDPQRAPAAPMLAGLLRPLTRPASTARALLSLLRLSEQPLLPAAGWVRAAHGAGASAAAQWDSAAGTTLVALIRAARRLPPGHPARPTPAAARRLLAAVPLRQRFQEPQWDPTLFGAWVESVWALCLQWALQCCEEPDALALLCWRLRTLHARAVLLDHEELIGGAGAAIRSLGRAALKGAARRWPDGPGGSAGPAIAMPTHIPAYALLARLENTRDGNDDTEHRAGRMVSRALAAAILEPTTKHAYVLFTARLTGEICGEVAGRWAMAHAVLRRPITMPISSSAPPQNLVDEALAVCERTCTELELSLESSVDDDSGPALAPLLPAAGEWAAARVALASATRRVELLRRVLDYAGTTHPECTCGSWQRSQYWEQAGAAARGAADPAQAQALAAAFPYNGFLVLDSGRSPLQWPLGARCSPGAALALALPAWLAADAAGYADHETGVAIRRISRIVGAGGRGGALLAALRLSLSARAPRSNAPAATLANALHHHPHSKALYVWGAGAGGAGGAAAAALPDLLLERGLRLHTLPDELAAVADWEPLD